MWSARTTTAFVGILLAAGCATVPPLGVDEIAIGDIVQRVKCEIAYAIPDPRGPYPTGPYQWMKYWTAKVDLTLVTNGQAALSPTAVFTKLLPNVAVPNVGNVARNVTLGLGAGVSTTASRTEVMSFTVSFEELRKWRRHGICDLPNGPELYGNLGLAEWVHSALGPVEFGQLKVGRHTAPGGKAAPALPVQTSNDPETRILQAVALAVKYADAAMQAAGDVARDAGRMDVQKAYDDAMIAYRQADAAVSKVGEARAIALDMETQTDKVKAALTRGDAAEKIANAARTAVAGTIEWLPHDAPIDSLTHSVNFVIAVSGNATPNWTLVNFKGPGANGNLISGTYTVTHTLAIAMGAPGGQIASGEQLRQLNNLVIQQLRAPGSP
jgi:hypothetical protein